MVLVLIMTLVFMDPEQCANYKGDGTIGEILLAGGVARLEWIWPVQRRFDVLQTKVRSPICGLTKDDYEDCTSGGSF